MKKIISISEVIELGAAPDQGESVLATAEANFEEKDSTLMVVLDCSLREARGRGETVHSRPAWLPAPEQILEKVPRAEAVELAKEIFQQWVNKLRRSIPALANST